MFIHNVKMDLCEDYSRLVSFWLKQEGIHSNQSGWELWYEYFNIQMKQIPSQKRIVLFSKEFSCPDHLKTGLFVLVKKLENGDDVSPYLSREASSSKKFDELLYDWGIHHLHLGEETDQKTGYIKRTKYVLFARIDRNTVYCINTYPHGKGVAKPWTKQEMVKILHRNWPHSIAKYRIPDVISASESLTDNQYAQLRDAHVSTFIEAEVGAVYMPPGGGYMSSGHSTEIMRVCQRINNALKKAELDISNNLAYYVSKIENALGEPLRHNPHFSLLAENRTLYVVEIHSMCRIMQIAV